MNKESEEIKRAIKKFYTLLNKCPKDSNSAYEFLSFLRYLIRIKTKEPSPTLEVMTVIKAYKPAVYQVFLRMSKDNLMLRILIEGSMGLLTAEKNLEEYLGE